METFVVVLAMAGGPHAVGPFASEAVCKKWVDLLNLARRGDWMGICYPMREFEREFPTLRIDADS